MKFVIVGGTGTLGRELVSRLEGHEIVVFSRDELKQSQMAAEYPKARFVLGDIRDRRSINGILKGADTVFHVAALKHVEFGEANPVEFIKTNVTGTINLAEAAMDAGVKNFVFSSTDKAVLPINTYGYTKGIAEKYLLSLNKSQDSTKFAVYKWANVAASRGSVIPLFVKSLLDEGLVRITDERMTRFFVTIDAVVEFMLSTYRDASLTEPMIPEMKATKIVDLAAAVAEHLSVKTYKTKVIGLRPGEKIHEVMISTHEYCMRSDTHQQFTRKELRALVKKVVT